MRYHKIHAKINTNKNLCKLFASLSAIFLIIRLGESSQIALPKWYVVDKSEIVLTATFRRFADTDYFALFLTDNTYKGSLSSCSIAVYLPDNFVPKLANFRAGDHFLLLLNPKESSNLAARLKFSQSTISNLELYIPTAVFNLTRESNEARMDAEYYKWFAQLQSSDGDGRHSLLIEGSQDNNTIITNHAQRALIGDSIRNIIQEIKQLPSIEQKAEKYCEILKSIDNETLEWSTIKFFEENRYTPALPIILEHFERLDDNHNMISHYLKLLKQYPDTTVGSVLLNKIQKWDLSKRIWKHSREMGELILHSLKETSNETFENLLLEIVNIVKSMEKPKVNEHMLQLFTPFQSPIRTKLMIELYELTKQDRILVYMAEGGEMSALPFLTKIFTQKNYQYADYVVRALSYYSENNVGHLLMDFIQYCEQQDSKYSAIAAFNNVLAHTKGDPSLELFEFFKSYLGNKWYGYTHYVISGLNGSKSDKVTEFIINEIKNAEDLKLKQKLVQSLRESNRNPNLTSDFLFKIIMDDHENYEIRWTAFWSLRENHNEKTFNRIIEIVLKMDNDWILRCNAARVLLDDAHPSASQALLELIKSFKSWDDLGKWNSYQSGFSYFNEDYLSEDELKKLDNYLASLYRNWISKESLEYKFHFINVLRKTTDYNFTQTFQVVSDDPSQHIREEVEFAIQEIKEGRKRVDSEMQKRLRSLKTGKIED